MGSPETSENSLVIFAEVRALAWELGYLFLVWSSNPGLTVLRICINLTLLDES